MNGKAVCQLLSVPGGDALASDNAGFNVSAISV